ncbi:MAG: acyl carrier protein [Pseudomonadota bacterium]|nr:acyl carrier protein [Pseudomonadota bacterium]
MTPDEITRHIAQALADVAPEADLGGVDPARPLRAQLDLDSMDFLRVVQGIHRLTGVEIPEADYPRIATLNALVAYLVAGTVRAPG